MTLGIGIIGCGDILTAYLARVRLFRGTEIRAHKHGVRAMDVGELLAASDIDVIVNLTIPRAHLAVSRAALKAGKHVRSEKPLARGTVEVIDHDENSRGTGRRRLLAVGHEPHYATASRGPAIAASAWRAWRTRSGPARAPLLARTGAAYARSVDGDPALGRDGRIETLSTSCTRPEPFDANARALMKEAVSA